MPGVYRRSATDEDGRWVLGVGARYEIKKSGPRSGWFTLVYGCLKAPVGLPLIAISAMSADMASGRVITL